MQIEFFENVLGAGQHALVFVLRFLRSRDRDQFDLGELMLADHATRVAPCCARFRAEARRQRGQPHRQFFFVEDGFADEIGQRHFGGGDEPEAIRVYTIIKFPILEVSYRFASFLKSVFFCITEYFITRCLRAFSSMSTDDMMWEKMELIFRKLRQLRCAEHRIVAHQERRIDLGVAMFASV